MNGFVELNFKNGPFCVQIEDISYFFPTKLDDKEATKLELKSKKSITIRETYEELKKLIKVNKKKLPINQISKFDIMDIPENVPVDEKTT